MTMLTVIIRFPYRLIPKLPPAKLLANVVGVSSDFIDERRKGLVRWLTITTSHPVIKAVWSTLIGRDLTLLRSHWPRASPVMLAPAILCHKEPSRVSKAPYFGTQNTPIGGYFACSSLVLYGIRAPIIGPFRAWKPTILRASKRKIPPLGGILLAPRWFFMA